MNREQALNFGVKQELYKEFQEQYNRDLNKRARDISERREGGKTALAVEYLRDAIGAMVRLIDDADTLQRLLASVNRTYSGYIYQHQRRNAEAASDTLDRQATAETDAGGRAECP